MKRKLLRWASAYLSSIFGCNANQNNGSLAYRKNKKKILEGNIPEKYTRIVPYVPGKRILEFGAAEGVLSLLLAEEKEHVTALEISEERHKESLVLKEQFRELGRQVENCRMVLGSIDDRPDLYANVDTIVAVRVIYHLKDVHKTLAAFGKSVENVVLCGNASRSREYYKVGKKAKNYYATCEGMQELLIDSGYEIATVLDEGDPIVVGKKLPNQS